MKCPRACPYDQSCPIGNVKEKIHPEPRKKKKKKKKKKKTIFTRLRVCIYDLNMPIYDSNVKWTKKKKKKTSTEKYNLKLDKETLEKKSSFFFIF